MRSVFHRAHVYQRAWQESADAVDHHGEAAFDLAVDHAGEDLAAFHGFFQSQPIGSAFSFFAGEFGFAEAVFYRFDGYGNEIADFNFQFALGVFEFVQINQGFGFQAGVHDNVFVGNRHYFGSNHLALIHFLYG